MLIERVGYFIKSIDNVSKLLEIDPEEMQALDERNIQWVVSWKRAVKNYGDLSKNLG